MKNTKQPQPSCSKLSVLRQLCNWIPNHLVPQLARETGVAQQARTFSPWSHVVSLLFSQLTHAIVFDRFHITQLVNEKLDDLRRAMVREATGLMKQTVTGVRYLLLMRREIVDAQKLPRLQEALKPNEPLNIGYLLKEALGLLWEQPSYAQMKSFLHECCAWAMESGVRQMQQVAKTLLTHASGILSWWKHRINHGRMEGINNKIKTLLRQTYGLRDERYFILRLYGLHASRHELLG